MIILLLKEKRRQRAGQRSSSMRVPPRGGLGRMSSAVCSESELRSVRMQISTDSSTDKRVMI